MHEPILAYIDPGAGSMMLQVILGVAIGVVIKFRAFLAACATSALARIRRRR